VPPLVSIGSGKTASALIEGVDSYDESGKGCPPYAGLLVTSPYASRALRVKLRFNGCMALEVHPVVAGTTGTM
jgi:hypothetical protein